MGVLFIFAFKIILLSFAQSQSATEFSHVCHIIGGLESKNSEFTFSMDDFPKRCEVVSYGNYNFDIEKAGNRSTYVMDEDAIKLLVEAQIPVIMAVGYFAEEPWGEIFDPKDQDLYNKRICPLIEKINELKLSGITLSVTDLYEGSVSELPTKIIQFVTKIKAQVPTLKVGLHVSANNAYDNITNNQLFDFSITNSEIDFYIVKMSLRNYTCNEEISNTGSLITSTDPNVLTLEKLCNAVSQSSMDKNKIFAKLYVAAGRPTDYGGDTSPYAQYCDSSNAAEVCTWCADNTKTLYDEAVYVKKTFHGISVGWLDYDDFLGTCDCKKYPATNTLFDGWEGAPLVPCPKMDLK